MKESVHVRLGKCHEEAQYASLKILDTKAWPASDEALVTYGRDLVQSFIDHFGQLVTQQGNYLFVNDLY